MAPGFLDVALFYNRIFSNMHNCTSPLVVDTNKYQTANVFIALIIL